MDKEKDRAIRMVREFKKNISRKVTIDKLIFFGSRAEGKGKKNSDIDLLLVSRDFRGKRYFQRSPIFYQLWGYPLDLDILCLTPEEFKEKQKQVGVIGTAAKTGLEI